MVDRRLIEQLDSRSPEQRKTAIQQLARSKDLGVIRYLDAIERSDSDASVRDLARKAIVYIRRNNPGSEDADAIEEKPKSASSRFAPGSIMSEYDNQGQEQPKQATPFTADVSDQRKKSARTALEMAGKAAFAEQNARATKYLVEAFRLDPGLQYDAYAVGMASTVTGLYKTDAVKAIMDRSALELFDKAELKGKPKKKVEEEGRELERPVGWGTALFDLLIYGLINAVIVAVTTIAIVGLTVDILSRDPQIQAELAAQPDLLTGILDQLLVAGIVTLIIYSALYGLFMILGLLISSFFIHVAASLILGGDGTLAKLIHKTALFLGIMAALVTGFQIASLFLPYYAPDLAENSLVFFGISLLLSGFTLGGYVTRIAKTYDFGAGRGCLALIISIIFLAVIGFVCIATLGQAVITQLTTQMTLTPGVLGP